MLGDLTDKLRNAAVSTDDKELYAIAAQEISSGAIDAGLWAKAFADSSGSEPQAQALYLRMRVVELIADRDDVQRQTQRQAQLLQQQREQAARNQQQALLVAEANARRQQEREREAKLEAAPLWERFLVYFAIFGGAAIFLGFLYFLFAVGLQAVTGTNLLK